MRASIAERQPKPPVRQNPQQAAVGARHVAPGIPPATTWLNGTQDGWAALPARLSRLRAMPVV